MDAVRNAQVRPTTRPGTSQARTGNTNAGPSSEFGANTTRLTRVPLSEGRSTLSEKALLAINVSPTASERDVFSLQPLAEPKTRPDTMRPDTMRNLYRVQRSVSMLKRFARHVEACQHLQLAQPDPERGIALTGGGKRTAWPPQPIATLENLSSTTHRAPPPPDEDMCADTIHTLKELICLVVGLNFDARIDVYKIDETPKKRLQNMMRNQLVIEHLIKLIDLAVRQSVGPVARVLSVWDALAKRRGRRGRRGRRARGGRRVRRVGGTHHECDMLRYVPPASPFNVHGTRRRDCGPCCSHLPCACCRSGASTLGRA